ncbi:MAG: glycosyltransferase family A protein, partial [Thermoanaerobaculia bacterium]
MQEPQSSLALSVIIPFAGSRTMRFMLQSLVLQSLPRSRYETIIVVEQGHSVDELLDLFNLQKHVRVVKYARPPGFGGHSAGPMRNAGAAVARAGRITFIDSDCIMDQDCLVHHDRDDDVVVCGGIRELSAFHQQSLAGEL